MSFFAYGARSKRSRTNTTSAIGLLVLASLMALTLGGSAGAASTSVPLGAGASFSVLAGAGTTNTGPTTISGDIGSFATTSMSGMASMTVGGVNHGGDGVTQQAKIDLVTAYNNAAGQGPTSPIVADLGGQTLAPGVYNSGSTIGLTGTVTLDAAGNRNAVFVFQAGSALTTASTSRVALINGAQDCNVFWKIGSDATLGTFSTFRGTILASSSITVTTGVTVYGRALARTGTVTLDTDTITAPGCLAANPPSRQIYCDAGGKAFDLEEGQNSVAPYDKLGLVVAHIDALTGSKSCTATVAATPPTTTTAATATTSTTTATTATPTGPTANQVAAAKAKRLAAVKAARIAKARRVAAAKSRHVALAKPKPRPAIHTFGFTG